jgi:RNA polymerase sigma-70 factor (ECF subfamily)
MFTSHLNVFGVLKFAFTNTNGKDRQIPSRVPSKRRTNLSGSGLVAKLARNFEIAGGGFVGVHAGEQVTQLLLRWSEGDASARDKLIPLVYSELHKLASAYLRRDQRDASLQPTALVNDAYIRLVAQTNVSWESRAQFFGLASTLMRNILVDHVRSKEAVKRGGQSYHVSLDQVEVSKRQDVDLLVLDTALTDLSRQYPEHCRVVEMRFFGGLSIEETAAALGSSHATVERQWKFARAWLRNKLSQ